MPMFVNEDVTRFALEPVEGTTIEVNANFLARRVEKKMLKVADRILRETVKEAFAEAGGDLTGLLMEAVQRGIWEECQMTINFQEHNSEHKSNNRASPNAELEEVQGSMDACSLEGSGDSDTPGTHRGRDLKKKKRSVIFDETRNEVQDVSRWIWQMNEMDRHEDEFQVRVAAAVEVVHERRLKKRKAEDEVEDDATEGVVEPRRSKRLRDG